LNFKNTKPINLLHEFWGHVNEYAKFARNTEKTEKFSKSTTCLNFEEQFIAQFSSKSKKNIQVTN